MHSVIAIYKDLRMCFVFPSVFMLYTTSSSAVSPYVNAMITYIVVWAIRFLLKSYHTLRIFAQTKSYTAVLDKETLS